MPRLKSPHKKKGKQFDFPRSMHQEMDELREDLRCDSLGELVRRSVALYKDYHARSQGGEVMASRGNNIHYLEVPKFDYDEERKRKSLLLHEDTCKTLVRLSSEDGCFEVNVVHDAIGLVKVLKSEIESGRETGYVSRESFREVIYDLLLPSMRAKRSSI